MRGDGRGWGYLHRLAATNGRVNERKGELSPLYLKIYRRYVEYIKLLLSSINNSYFLR